MSQKYIWEDGRTDESLGEGFGWLVAEDSDGYEGLAETATGVVDDGLAIVYGSNHRGIDTIIAAKKVANLDEGRAFIEETAASTPLRDIDTREGWTFNYDHYAYVKDTEENL